jgi:hypothetical protein
MKIKAYICYEYTQQCKSTFIFVMSIHNNVNQRLYLL